MDLPIVAAGQAANDEHQAEREKLGLKEDAHAGYGHFEAGAKVTDTDASSDVDFRAPTEEEQRSLRRIPAVSVVTCCFLFGKARAGMGRRFSREHAIKSAGRLECKTPGLRKWRKGFETSSSACCAVCCDWAVEGRTRVQWLTRASPLRPSRGLPS